MEEENNREPVCDQMRKIIFENGEEDDGTLIILLTDGTTKKIIHVPEEEVSTENSRFSFMFWLGNIKAEGGSWKIFNPFMPPQTFLLDEDGTDVLLIFSALLKNRKFREILVDDVIAYSVIARKGRIDNIFFYKESPDLNTLLVRAEESLLLDAPGYDSATTNLQKFFIEFSNRDNISIQLHWQLLQWILNEKTFWLARIAEERDLLIRVMREKSDTLQGSPATSILSECVRKFTRFNPDRLDKYEHEIFIPHVKKTQKILAAKVKDIDTTEVINHTWILNELSRPLLGLENIQQLIDSIFLKALKKKKASVMAIYELTIVFELIFPSNRRIFPKTRAYMYRNLRIICSSIT